MSIEHRDCSAFEMIGDSNDKIELPKIKEQVP